MKTIRTMAAGLLLLTGALHLISVAVAKFEATSIITIVFGVAYLAIGYFLFRDGRTILWAGATVPLLGLLLAVAGMFKSPTVLGGIFIAIDVVIIVCCFILLFRKG